jgi:Response regulator containing CheY-like receiver domain and AraC-type DNA-binding domain
MKETDMFKVMIADDEKVAIDSLKFIIEKSFNDVEVISTARSGREAIEKVEENTPDILFMDIRMPGINGIDAIREIRKKYSQIVIIVLTAFDQFEFAKEAVNLGVMEYLLKPVNRSKVVEVVERAVGLIRVEKEKRQLELEMREKLEYVGPILENGFVYSLILFDYNKELVNYQHIFELKEEGGYIFTVEFVDPQTGGIHGDKIGISVQSQQFYPFFTDTVKSLCKCIIGSLMVNRIVVVVPSSPGTDEFACRLEAVSLAEMLMERLSEKLNCGLRIGIGKTYKRFDMLSASYEESLKALRYLQGEGIMHYMDITARSTPAESEYPEYKEKLLLQKVSVGDVQESVSAFCCIFDWLAGEYADQPLKIKNKLLEIVFLVNRMSWEYEPGGGTTGEAYLEEMLSIKELEELRVWCKKRLETVISQINSYRDYKAGGLTKRAKEYIKSNYSKSITLEDVAREINVSPQYLSKLFKEETGENFIDYLTGIRIRIAKTILESEELSIKEICYSIGYSDPNYFSRIFKKNVGVTPTEYKDEFLNRTSQS